MVSMDSMYDCFGELTISAWEANGSRYSLEYPLRDVVLPFVVPQVHVSGPWESENPVTIATVDSIRGTSRSWKSFVEGTVEWGAIVLVRRDFDSLVPPVWVTEEDFVLSKFEAYRCLLKSNWILRGPLADDRWRTAYFGDLTEADLAGLCVALDEAVESVETPATGFLKPNPTLWITPTCRGAA